MEQRPPEIVLWDAFSQGKWIQNKPSPITQEDNCHECPFHGAAAGGGSYPQPQLWTHKLSQRRFLSLSAFFFFKLKQDSCFSELLYSFMGHEPGQYCTNREKKGK